MNPAVGRTEWVKAGAPWPTAAAGSTTTGNSPAASVGKPSSSAMSSPAPGYVITPEQRAFWSFQPIHPAPVPAVSHTSWPKTDIDRFVLARLEKEGLAPTKAADKVTLIRRASLDLTGLPPSPEEVDAFLSDRSPDAYEKVLDRLMRSPRYGEQMARSWLDAARYADSPRRYAS